MAKKARSRKAPTWDEAMAKKARGKAAPKPVEKTLLEEFRSLLEEAPLDFMGTGDRGTERQAEKYFQEVVDKFETRLAAAEQELGELRARVYDDQQSGADYG